MRLITENDYIVESAVDLETKELMIKIRKPREKYGPSIYHNAEDGRWTEIGEGGLVPIIRLSANRKEFLSALIEVLQHDRKYLRALDDKEE